MWTPGTSFLSSEGAALTRFWQLLERSTLSVTHYAYRLFAGRHLNIKRVLNRMYRLNEVPRPRYDLLNTGDVTVLPNLNHDLDFCNPSLKTPFLYLAEILRSFSSKRLRNADYFLWHSGNRRRQRCKVAFFNSHSSNISLGGCQATTPLNRPSHINQRLLIGARISPIDFITI